MAKRKTIEKILTARESLRPAAGIDPALHNPAAEGGCGVIGIACSERIAGRHLLQSLDQMKNRGNGKGGGIAAVGVMFALPLYRAGARLKEQVRAECAEHRSIAWVRKEALLVVAQANLEVQREIGVRVEVVFTIAWIAAMRDDGCQRALSQ